ncbi:eCIS core domain-containing protein [Paenibacillus germinis]|nr:DUF4157 domain-containing protein [Paenibacillus germinis]
MRDHPSKVTNNSIHNTYQGNSSHSPKVTMTPSHMMQLQKTIGNRAVAQMIQTRAPLEKKETPPSTGSNQTSMPANLKSGIENLSGLSMDDVRVHYNSSKPSELNALAYAQGSDIHLGPGQEKHLPHEAWHVVQQKQGRVQPSRQFKGTDVNDNPDLEQEADEMGALAELNMTEIADAGETPIAGSPLTPPTSSSNGTAQLFADKHNEDRLKAARTASGVQKMQLDHSVSQDTMKKLDTNIQKLKLSMTPAKNLFTQTKEAYDRFMVQSGDMDEAATHADNLRTMLLNLRNNITPGFQETTGNPGSGFDPQIEMDGENSVQNELSAHLLKLDTNARKLERLPIPYQHEVVRIENYNKKLDDEIANTLDAITESLAAIKDGDKPEYDPEIWYRNGEGASDKYVKRVGAEWKDAKPDNLGEEEGQYPTLAETDFEWEFKLPNFKISDKNTELNGENQIEGEDTYEEDMDVYVSVKIPVKCWEHIYDRHYIPTFKGDVQAINTFWKEDPLTAITAELLEPEINLLLDRKINLRNMINNENITENVNEFVNQLFFQGSIGATYSYGTFTVDAVLKSIAPQDSNLGYGIEPNVLNS